MLVSGLVAFWALATVLLFVWTLQDELAVGLMRFTAFRAALRVAMVWPWLMVAGLVGWAIDWIREVTRAGR
jgi:hypothetical protein